MSSVCFCTTNVVSQEAYAYKAGYMDIKIPSSLNPRIKRKIEVTIFTPKIVHGNILVLPGWKFNRKQWLQKTQIVALAKKYHLRLICPEMNTSLYASKYFPNTKLKWSATPGLQWIVKILIPQMQKNKVFLIKQNNYILGLSTGGRGVAQIGLALPQLWNAAAALSGDFDQSTMPKDKLMKALYGRYSKFSDRWKTFDNPYYKARDWKIPLYLAHGKRDTVVPFSQSKNFYEALKDSAVYSQIVFTKTQDGHNYKFWNAQVVPAIQFFLKYAK